jgi:hypothetical protein
MPSYRGHPFDARQSFAGHLEGHSSFSFARPFPPCYRFAPHGGKLDLTGQCHFGLAAVGLVPAEPRLTATTSPLKISPILPLPPLRGGSGKIGEGEIGSRG